MAQAPKPTGIVDYTIDGLGPTGPSGEFGTTGATAYFKDMRYLADCNDCWKVRKKYAPDGKVLDGSEPDGATGWWVGASGGTGATYTGPDYTVDPTQIRNLGWGQTGAGEAVASHESYKAAQRAEYVTKDYFDCMTCGCPINHVDNKNWKCELTIEAMYWKNERCEPATVYLITNPEAAQKEMSPNLEKLRPLIAKYEKLTYTASEGWSGKKDISLEDLAGATGATGLGASGATGYFILDGETGKIVSAVGSSGFVSAFKDLAHGKSNMPLTSAQLGEILKQKDLTYDAIMELIGDRNLTCDAEKITHKKAVMELSCDCSGDDSTSHTGVKEGGIFRDSYNQEIGYGIQGNNYYIGNSCCCTDCSKTTPITGKLPNGNPQPSDDEVRSWYLKLPAQQSNKAQSRRTTVTITQDHVSCRGGDCYVHFFVHYPEPPSANGKYCRTGFNVAIVDPDDEKFDKAYEADPWTFWKKYYGFISSTAGGYFDCQLNGQVFSQFCGTKENPDRLGLNEGFNRTSSQEYDFTLSNTQYP